MKHGKALRMILAFAVLGGLPLFSQQKNNFVAFDVKDMVIKTDRNDNNLELDWFYGHVGQNWNMRLGVQMRDDILDASGDINLFDTYFKKFPVRPGTSLGAYYHLKFLTTDTYMQDLLLTGSLFLDIVPTRTRLTGFFGGGVKGDHLAVDDHTPPVWTTYPIASLYLSQGIAERGSIMAGLSTYSYFTGTAFIEPQVFAHVEWKVNPSVSFQGGVSLVYGGFEKLKDVSFGDLELQSVTLGMGIKYSF